LPVWRAFPKMPARRRFVPITGILAAFMNLAAAAHTAAMPVDRPVVRVLVHSEAAFAVNRRMLTEIVRTAHEIWRPYADVTFDFAEEGVRSTGSLRLVVTDRISTVSDGASLGWIEFVGGQPSNVITVSTTAAAALMKASRWGGLPKSVQRSFLVRAMARAIAHELGHYLLASREHTAHGLMRGQLTADDIMQPHRSSYRLDRKQVASLQRGVQFARSDEKTLTTKDPMDTKGQSP
jgi:hypothetical protein